MDVFEGRISSSGFESGDRFVIGDWHSSPLGPFANVLWAKPDGTRILISGTKKNADYVSSLYNFEEVIITEIFVERLPKGIQIKAGPLEIEMHWNYGLIIPFSRPRWFISTVELFFAKILFGTKTYGITSNNLKEWYCINRIAKIHTASAKCNGIDLNNMTNFETNACFGFSEPPKKPTSVMVRSIIESNIS
ncbi:MAG: hypothetical protein QGI21_04075 [Candidatus Poseidoniaceae archaeon]|jgi:hypothetical protein|nr:hypothetical protein [Candidatus Poseidoniaceae archaeon]